MIDKENRLRLSAIIADKGSTTRKWEQINGLLLEKEVFRGDAAIDIALEFWVIFDPEYAGNLECFYTLTYWQTVIKSCILFLSSCQEYIRTSPRFDLKQMLLLLSGHKCDECVSTHQTNHFWPFIDEAQFQRAIAELSATNPAFS